MSQFPLPEWAGQCDDVFGTVSDARKIRQVKDKLPEEVIPFPEVLFGFVMAGICLCCEKYPTCERSSWALMTLDTTHWDYYGVT